MNHGDDIHLIWLQVVDNSVGPFKHFTDLWKLGFGNDAARLWERANLLRSPCQPIDDSLCIFWRTVPDVGVKGLKVADGRVGPVDLHFGSPNEARTCSTSVVLPAVLSAIPDSMAWRT